VKEKEARIPKYQRMVAQRLPLEMECAS